MPDLFLSLTVNLRVRTVLALAQNSLDHLWHRNFAVFLEGVHHQAIAADVVNALVVVRWAGQGQVGGAGSGKETSV